MVTVLVLAALGCATRDAGTQPGGDSVSGADTGDDYLGAAPSAGAAAPSVDVIGAAVAEALTRVRDNHASPVFPAYEEAMAAAEGSCPAFEAHEAAQSWYDNCTTPSGATFDGYASYTAYAQAADPTGAVVTGGSLDGTMRVTGADGSVFRGAGEATELEMTAADSSVVTFESTLRGTFVYDGPAAAGTSLEGGLTSALTVTAQRWTTTHGRMMAVDGELFGLSDGFQAAAFYTLTLFDAAAGGDCPEEPGGMVSVQAEDGRWVDVTLDGESAIGKGVADSACDGCGTAWLDGVSIGQVCADFAPMTHWGETPW